MSEYLLGIDNGGTATKAAIFGLDGREEAVASRAVKILFGQCGWSERDMETMWRDTVEVIREVLHMAAIPAEAIKGVGCTGHGNGAYFINAAGLPVRNAINSTDTRAQSYVDDWRSTGIEASVRKVTAQRLWAAQPPALLAWIRDHEPRTLNETEWLLMCKDYVRFRLTGGVYAEKTDYSGCNLLNLIRGTYDTQILDLFGISELASILPPITDSAAICGTVTNKAATETGLKVGTPVAGGLFDIDACCLGSGVYDHRRLAIVAGTWGNNLAVSEEIVNDDSIFMTSCFAIPGKFLLLEGSPTSAGNLDWIIQLLGLRGYDSAETEASSCDPTEVFFLPFLYGSNAHPLAKATFIGMQSQTTRPELIRSAYEGICFAHRVHVDRLLDTQQDIETIRLSGGAAKSNFWSQLFANCLRMPVETLDCRELGAKGAAITAGLAVGAFASYEDAVEAMIGKVTMFRPQPHVDYEAKYAKYCQVVRCLDSVWPKLGGQ